MVVTNTLKNNWKILVLLTFLVSLAYTNSLGNQFVSDDKGLLLESSRLTHADFIFRDPLSFVRSLFYAALYMTCGLLPVCFHLLNFAFHLGNTLLVFLIVSWLADRKAAVFTAAFFAVHPALTEAVTWLSGGPYSQYTFFFLLSFLFYIKDAQKHSKVAEHSRQFPVYYLVSMAFFLISLLSSNRVMALFPIFYLYEFVFGNLRANWPKLLPYTGASILWLTYYSALIPARIQNLNQYNFSEGTFYNPLQQLPVSIFGYLTLIFWPLKLSFAHVPDPQLFKPILGVIALAAVFIITYLKNKLMFFWLGFFLIGLALYLTPLKISWLVAERYLYLSSIGLLAILGIIFSKSYYLKRWPTILVFTLIISLLSYRTIIRNQDWQNELSLVKSTLRENPYDTDTYNFLGNYYLNLGQEADALDNFHKALRVAPDNYLTNYNLGYFYKQKGKPDEALFFFRRALKANGNSLVTLQNLSQINFKVGHYDQALLYANQALILNPQDESALEIAIQVYLKLNDQEKARSSLELLRTIKPDHKLLTTPQSK